MAYYWEPNSPYNRTASSSSSGKKIAAVLVILMLVISSGIIVLFNLLPGIVPSTNSEEKIRVAVVDSGLDVDLTIAGRIGPQQSFISTVYGYDSNDPSTSDSNPDDGSGGNVRHGTLVTQTLLQNSINVEVAVAKVIDSGGSATASGVVAGILWAIEQNCSIINLSLGSSPTFGDPLEETVEYAHSRGVIIVSAAGNEGNSGVAGSSISSPSIYPTAISVGALDDDDIPAEYTSYGPTASRYMKPDISIEGFAETTNAIYFGTSFASPRIAAMVADLIVYCNENNIAYTPGMIQAALYEGAISIEYPSYVVGAGKASLLGAIQVINQAPRDSDLPLITFVHPIEIPLDFERLFLGDNYTFNVRVVTSGVATFSTSLTSLSTEMFDLPTTVIVNQSELVPLSIYVPTSSIGTVSGEIVFDAGLHEGSVSVSFRPDESIAKIAFDVSHTPWDIDTVYGQFKELYIELTDNDISVTEIQNRSLITTEYLSNFDAVFVLDPCAYGTDETNYNNPTSFSVPYTQGEIDAYEDYYLQGGGIFVSALNNDSVNVTAVNEFLEWSGFSLFADRIPTFGNVVSISDVTTHPITSGIVSFAFAGAAISFNSSAQSLATYNGRDVLGAMTSSSGGRLVVTGTNFFIDNWGLNGLYQTSSDREISLKIALWLIGNI